MDQELIDFVGSLDEKKLRELYESQRPWGSLPAWLKSYYNIKRGFFVKPIRIVILVTLALVFAGLSAYFFKAPLQVAFAFFVGGIIFGIILTWLIESK